MCQPHFFYLCFFREFCRLFHRHMLVFSRFCVFFRFSVHSLTYQQIRFFCMFFHRYRRTTVRTVCDFQTFSCRSKYHIRCIHLSACLDGLTFLQWVPVFQWNLVGFCLFHREFSTTANLYGIAVTGHIMVHPKRRDLIPPNGKFFFLPLNFFANNWKWKFRSNGTKSINHPFKSFRSDQGQRFRTFCISHSQ